MRLHPTPLMLAMLMGFSLACIGGKGDVGDTAPSSATDNDGDGFAATDDCDDSDDQIHPDAAERCDGLDNDCDGDIDESGTDASTWYLDSDGDGYGTPNTSQTACSRPEGYVLDSNDCDDSDPLAHGEAVEVCDGSDNDCDGLIDDDDDSLDRSSVLTWYRDDDGDGVGTNQSTTACTAPQGYADENGDCDDGDRDVFPGAREVCDGVDNDCDDLVDDEDDSVNTSDGGTWYVDNDGDGYGDTEIQACEQPSGTSSQSGDCDDGDSSSHPGAPEPCDNADNDCDGRIDEDPCTSCGDGTVDSGEEVDPPNSSFSTLSIDSNTCRWDLSGVSQLYCNGTCSWGGANDCDQADADIFCQLITDNPNATARSYSVTTPLAAPGFPCPRSDLGTVINTDRGVSASVYYTDTNISSNHGSGDTITSVVCN